MPAGWPRPRWARSARRAWRRGETSVADRRGACHRAGRRSRAAGSARGQASHVGTARRDRRTDLLGGSCLGGGHRGRRCTGPVARRRARCWNSIAPGHLDEVQDLAAQGLAAARRTGDLTEIHESVFMQLLGATILGDFDEFDRIEQERAPAASGANVYRDNWSSASPSEPRKLLLTASSDAAERPSSMPRRSAAASARRSALAGSTLQDLAPLVAAAGRPSGRADRAGGGEGQGEKSSWPGTHRWPAGSRRGRSHRRTRCAHRRGPRPCHGCCLRAGLALPIVTGRSVFWNARLALAAELRSGRRRSASDHGPRGALAGWSSLQANYSTLMYLGPLRLLGRLKPPCGRARLRHRAPRRVARSASSTAVGASRRRWSRAERAPATARSSAGRIPVTSSVPTHC